jgi:hypothetical protein
MQDMSARQILHVCTQMKSAPIPPELAVNHKTFMKLMVGEQRNLRSSAHLPVEVFARAVTEVDGRVSRSGPEDRDIQVYLFTLVGSVIPC